MVEPLNVNNTPQGRAPIIENEDQAQAMIRGFMTDMLKWRENCNVQFPGDTQRTVQYQQRALWTFLNKQGQVQGALKAFHRCGLLSDRGFEELTEQAVESLRPTVTGIS